MYIHQISTFLYLHRLNFIVHIFYFVFSRKIVFTYGLKSININYILFIFLNEYNYFIP